MELIALSVALGRIGWVVYGVVKIFIFIFKKIYSMKWCKYKPPQATPGPACVICRLNKVCDRVWESKEYFDYAFDKILCPEKAEKLFNEIAEKEKANSRHI